MEKDGFGSQAYELTSAREITRKVWRGAALTPGDKDEISSLRLELREAIKVLLVIYAVQVQHDIRDFSHTIIIWIDNDELLSRAMTLPVGNNIKYHLLLEYDVWRVMANLQILISISLRWKKLDSHIEDRTYKEGLKLKESIFFYSLE